MMKFIDENKKLSPKQNSHIIDDGRQCLYG
jgi:hypothetical protein